MTLSQGLKVQKELRNLEDKQLVRAHKIGVIYCKEGQISEEEMLNNGISLYVSLITKLYLLVSMSESFIEFLEFLGDTIDLTGWDKYAGGLDGGK